MEIRRGGDHGLEIWQGGDRGLEASVAEEMWRRGGHWGVTRPGGRRRRVASNRAAGRHPREAGRGLADRARQGATTPRRTWRAAGGEPRVAGAAGEVGGHARAAGSRGTTRRGPRGAAHSTRARQGPALAGQARAPQGRGRRGFGGASGCRRCSSVRAGSRWGGGTEATGGERASRAQQGGGQRRRSDARGREADSGKPRGGRRPRAQGA